MNEDLIHKKLDRLIDAQANINKMLAIHEMQHQQKKEEIKELKETASQYKADRYRVIGGSGVLAALVSYFVKH